MDKEDVVCIYNEILFSMTKKEISSFMKDGGPWEHYAKWNESEKDKSYVVSPTCGIWKSQTHRNGKMVASWDWRQRTRWGVSQRTQTFSCKISRLWRSTNMVLKIIKPKRQQWLLMTNMYESSITSLEILKNFWLRCHHISSQWKLYALLYQESFEVKFMPWIWW